MLAAVIGCGFAHASSYYPIKPMDDSLVALTKEAYPALHADGLGDDSDVLQAAINAASAKGSVLLVPEGRYLLSKTVGVPPSTRLLGFGKNRPVFVLPANTVGFDDPEKPKYMIWFSGGGGGGRRRGQPAATAPTTAPATRPNTFSDASPGTFYSGLSNIDFEIGDGNKGAVAIRGHYAQHGIVSHVDFQIGSGFAGINGVGNEAEDLHFHGGTYGIVSTGTSPSWQYTLVDSSFDGQRVAAVRTRNTGLTLIGDDIRNVPTAIAIEEERDERLWMSDCKFENISEAAIVVGNEGNVRTQINVEEIACNNVPIVAAYAQSKTHLASGKEGRYVIGRFGYGLEVADLGERPVIQQTYETRDAASADADKAKVILPLPPMETWVSVAKYGAKGDSLTDDTAAIRTAVKKERVLFFPRGHYRVTDSITLKPDTVIIGLNPITTQIGVDDNEKNFMGEGEWKGVIESAKGGTNIIQGVSLDSGAMNNRAVGLKWTAGEKSMVNDVKFLGGHGTSYPDGRRDPVYNADHTGDSNPDRKWSSEPPSLWITDGGGGIFADIWTASTFSAAGMQVDNTQTPGKIYELSSEHHQHNEIIFRHVSNWRIFAEQTEEEWGEGPVCLPLTVDDCSNLVFANTILFRVFAMNAPYPTGIQVSNSKDITFRGIRTYGQSPFNFDNSILDSTLGMTIPSREISSVYISGNPTAEKKDAAPSPVVADGAAPQKVGEGYTSADHAVTDSAGNVYFVDMLANKIFRCSAETFEVNLLRDDVTQPFALAVDKADDLLIMSRAGKVFSLSLKEPKGALTELQGVPAVPRPAMAAVIPTDRWWDGGMFLETCARREPLQFISPDQTLFIPVPADYATGRQHNWTSQPIDLYRKNQLAIAEPGKPFYVADENEHKTWAFTASDDGTLSAGKMFAQHGEAGVTTDSAGNVYVAEGEVYVYDAAGKQIDSIHVPERPLSIVFCGNDRSTIFITGRRAAYLLKMKVKGS